jgi:hypothetical protein
MMIDIALMVFVVSAILLALGVDLGVLVGLARSWWRRGASS